MMESRKKNRTGLIAVIGILLLAVILIGGTIWMGQSAHKDTVEAVRSVSLLYLDELAGRREQVVEGNLSDSIEEINIAVGLITEEDLSDLEHMRAYQREMKQLFNLERFAFVDSDGLVYTADEGVREDIGDYDFDPQTIDGPVIFVKNPDTPEKKAVIAVPIRDRELSIDGKQLIVCFMEIDMDVMLKAMNGSIKRSWKDGGRKPVFPVTASYGSWRYYLHSRPCSRRTARKPGKMG